MFVVHKVVGEVGDGEGTQVSLSSVMTDSYSVL